MSSPLAGPLHLAIGVDTPEAMTRTACSYTNARAIKLKLTGEPADPDRVRAVRSARPIGQEAWLDDFESSIPIAADESVQNLSDVASLVGRFQVVNIKLDKCGGLTEGLEMARAAHSLGLRPMVGNLLGTSLAMAPAYLLGQLCDIVDLDGPIFLTTDRSNPISYADGLATCSQVLWG